MKTPYRVWDAGYLSHDAGQTIFADTSTAAASAYANDVHATKADVIAVLDYESRDMQYYEIQGDGSLEPVEPCDPEA